MILVTGDVVLDHNVYEGERISPDAPPGNGSHSVPIPGGALLTYGLLNALEPGCARFGLAQTTKEHLQLWVNQQFHTRALWHPVANGDKPKDGKHWALERYLGYGEPQKPGKPGESAFPGTPARDLNDAKPKILILDDGGLGFRAARSCWPASLSGDRPADLEWVILKMSRPLATGELWLQLMRDSWRRRLIVIISADQLRSEGLRVAGGLSWETSVDDIVGELESNGPLGSLRQCRHLIVNLRGDASLWLDQPSEENRAKLAEPLCQLIFDRKRCEGEWAEINKDWRAYGFQSIVTAAVAWSIAKELKPATNEKEEEAKLPHGQLDFTVALAAGLSGTRFLRKYGHGPVPDEPRFPFAEAAKYIEAEIANHGTKKIEYSYSAAHVRRVGDKDLIAGRWTILGQVSPWHARKNTVSYEPARHVALYGPDKLPSVPCATFGKLQTLDRREIDSLRALRHLMLLYRDGGPRKQPLCLAVFGAPGSGKSFGLKEIAKGVFGDKTEILEFNLSQFSGSADLIGAFHQVRDKVLAGTTPVVFWDEFDSEDLKWLRYLLAPMEDGQFQEGQITHFVGKSVFVFAGGTRDSFADFNILGNGKDSKEHSDFKFKKGPDFVSRLAGYLDMAGPNPRKATPDSDADREYPVRRAMVIRNSLELGDRELATERGLLTALLALRRYKNGARSLKKLVNYIKDRGGFPLRRAYLPPDDILGLYVEDVEEFHQLTRKYAAFHAQADILAPAIHKDYLKGLSPAEKLSKPNTRPWDELNPDIRGSNYAAALRIPAILELVGLALEEGATTSPKVKKRLADKTKVELMAEAEHGRWEEHKRIGGWTYSRNRMDEVLRHDLLVPYEHLTDKLKAYDRSAIKNYRKNAELAGFGIVPLPKSKVK
jgi:hypothetical protein